MPASETQRELTHGRAVLIAVVVTVADTIPRNVLLALNLRFGARRAVGDSALALYCGPWLSLTCYRRAQMRSVH